MALQLPLARDRLMSLTGTANRLRLSVIGINAGSLLNVIWRHIAVASWVSLVRMHRLFLLETLADEEGLQDVDNLLESGKVLLELGIDLVLVIAELAVKVLAVRTGTHGGAEDGLDQEAVVGLEGAIVGSAEGGRELLVGGGDIVGETLAGEVETSGGLFVSRQSLLPEDMPTNAFLPDEPEKGIPGLFLLGLLLVVNKVLDSLGLGRGGKETLADFL